MQTVDAFGKRLSKGNLVEVEGKYAIIKKVYRGEAYIKIINMGEKWVFGNEVKRINTKGVKELNV